MDVEVLTDDDWKLLQDLRLRALEESPDAFLSKADAGRAGDEAYWRERCTRNAWVVARIGRQAVGMACSVQDPEQPPYVRHIESVWVDPDHREKGVLRAMLRQLVEREPAVRDWYVWVLDGSDLARGVYEHLGFATTGERQTLAGSFERSEERLKLIPGPTDRGPLP
ncbi:GNAT family N-acetyltransferase [Kribbella italica]|uniref:GNAT superfamily N-acetyltransferase n=1 Tax=Kribbella italica TaxID=1540520 RepID=A0A7W9JDZ9_9ACTN|nr:GNAT family N-acetyltransferase [Kribbella italica]MBB5839980.1 GNAT superfamily N-acetyltransferase [Kribbella italica]